MGAWAEADADVLTLVAKRLPMDDFDVFRRVCTSWRAVATKENCSRKIRVPWRMIPNVQINLTSKVYIPETQSFKLFCPRPGNGGNTYQLFFPLQIRWSHCRSSLGWILHIGQQELNVDLVNPITGDVIKLPTLNRDSDMITRFVLSDDPSHARSYTVAIVLATQNSVMFWRSGSNEWTTVDHPQSGEIHDLICYRGQFMSIADWNPKIVVYDFRSPADPPSPTIFFFELPNVEFPWYKRIYLVESAGSLLIVFQHGPVLMRTDHFKVFEVDLALDFSEGGNPVEGSSGNRPLYIGHKSSWNPVKSLGNRSLYVGHNSSFSIEVTPNEVLLGFKPNCIHYSDPKGRGMTTYKLVDGTIYCYPGGNAPQVWIQPTF